MDGILIIRKEKGYTSHDVVARLRGILHQKKIGHTGTLDPDAEGVLPVCLGRATKVCDMLTDTDKEYVAVLRLGVVTDTQDMTGRVLRESEDIPEETAVREAVLSFEGDYDQIPPMYSALKRNGKKLVDLAREGKEVERDPRRVRIYRIVPEETELPRMRIRVSCSKGTYIRTLCHDIGEKLGCGGAMESLVRTRAAGFSLEEALTLQQVEERRDAGTLEERILPLESVFSGLPVFTVLPEREKALRNGNRLKVAWGTWQASVPEAGETAVRFPDGSFAAVYDWLPEENLLKPRKLFL